jgi:hypothetical protein
MIGPALPLSPAESDALAGEGTLGPALAAHSWAFVYCEHGAFRGDDWHEHTHDTDIRTHVIYAIQRKHPDYMNDCVLVLR